MSAPGEPPTGAGGAHAAGAGAEPGASSFEGEEQLRAAYEEELRRITATDMIAQASVTLLNIGASRLAGAGAEQAPGEGPPATGPAGGRDLEQARDAIDGVRALLPVLERREGAETLRPLREALSALQLEYAKLAAGTPPSGEPSGGAPSEQEPPPVERGPGPAQRSGRLWVPGS